MHAFLKYSKPYQWSQTTTVISHELSPPSHWAFLCHTAVWFSVPNFDWWNAFLLKCERKELMGSPIINSVLQNTQRNEHASWKWITKVQLRKSCHHQCRIQSVLLVYNMLHLLHVKGFNKEPSNTDERCWKCTESNCPSCSVFMKVKINPKLFLSALCWVMYDEMYPKWGWGAKTIFRA